MAVDVFQFIEKLKSADTPDQMFQVFADAVAAMGFDQAFYGYSIIADDTDLSDNAGIHSNFDPRFLETYEAEHLADHDISVRHCTVSDLPAPWFDQAILSRLKPEELQVEQIAMDHGYKAGLTIPAREGADGLFGGISVATRELSQPDFERVLTENAAPLQLMALCLHAEIQKKLNPFPETLLTAREKEVLMWASLGLSSKATARKLGIAFRTVEWHLESARVKLCANNKVHAVSKAIAHGLIPL